MVQLRMMEMTSNGSVRAYRDASVDEMDVKKEEEDAADDDDDAPDDDASILRGQRRGDPRYSWRGSNEQ